MKDFDVIVIGAGAAGLMCAIEAGNRGRRVLVVDHANKIGKKILIAGGGRCNFTNMYAGPENYLSRNPHFCKSALARYTPWDFIALVEKHGIPYHEKKLGQLFCDNSSKDILAMLVAECQAAGVTIRSRMPVKRVEKDGRFRVTTEEGELGAESLVIATGGLSFAQMGASGFGYDIARHFGLGVTATRAGLVPLTLEGNLLESARELAGISLDSLVACRDQGFRENILFTHKGVSGPAILQISSYWQPGDALEVDLAPGENLLEWLKARKQARPEARLATVLGERFPNRFVQAFKGRWFRNKPMQHCSHRDLEALAQRLQAWRFKPSGSEGYPRAEVTIGGVDTDGISSKTLEAKSVPGLYFIGEVLDVTGQLGGYNFQWAWASGFCAGQVV